MILDSTPTTTGQKFSPQKYRGHTLEILGVLSECGGLTTREIADRIDLPRKEAYEYCHRGYRSGIIERTERWGWSVSPLGMLVLSLFTTTTTTDHTTTTQQPHKDHTKTTQKQRQLNLAVFTSREDITDSERVVVEALGGLYERVGQAYMVFKDEYELFEKLGLNVIDDETVLRDLVNKGCIYKLHVKGELKIGLRKGQIELMKYV